MSDRPPLILLHGYLGCAADWGTQPDGVHALDLPGHGASFAAIHDIHSFDDAVEWQLEQIDALGISQFDVCGYSMGGRIAYGLVTTAPHRVRRFVALGSAPDCNDRDERRIWVHQLAKQLRHWGLDDFLTHWYAQPLFDSFRASPAFPFVLKRRRVGDANALAHALEKLSLAEQPDFWAPLCTTTRPGLLVAGAQDTKYVRLLGELAAEGPSLSAHVIPDAGHALLAEAPDAVLRVLDEFLN